MKKEGIIQSLEPLFREAEARELWFYSSYQSIWLSPNELRVHQASDRFLWGAPSWQLRHPEERLAQLEHEIVQKQQDLDDFKRRIIS